MMLLLLALLSSLRDTSARATKTAHTGLWSENRDSSLMYCTCSIPSPYHNMRSHLHAYIERSHTSLLFRFRAKDIQVVSLPYGAKNIFPSFHPLNALSASFSRNQNQPLIRQRQERWTSDKKLVGFQPQLMPDPSLGENPWSFSRRESQLLSSNNILVSA